MRNLVEGRWTLADTGREPYPPCGLWGGKPGKPSDHLLRRPGEAEFKHVSLIRDWVPSGSEGMVVTAGGGGWGDPLERDPEKVQWDVREGYVSLGAAKDEYGVVLDPKSLQIKVQETERLRASLRGTSRA